LPDALAAAIGRQVLAGQAIFAKTPRSQCWPSGLERPGPRDYGLTGAMNAADGNLAGSAIPPASLAIVLEPMADNGAISVLV